MTTLLIDVSFLAHQAKATIPNLTAGDVGTGVTFGVLNRILSLGKIFSTNQMIFCFDSPTCSVRATTYLKYKGNRHNNKEDQPPEERMIWSGFKKQIVELRENVLPLIGWKNCWVVDGFEADDIMAAFSRRANTDNPAVIVTADQDLFQCIREHVACYNPSTKITTNVPALKQRYGITPSQWLQMKILAGCSGDNVDGIPGVAEKTAIKYILKELPVTHKIYSVIREELPKIRERNFNLVSLPHPEFTGLPFIKPNEFSKKGFREVCEKYWLNSFLKPEALVEWGKLFRGEFKGGSAPEAKISHGTVTGRRRN